MREKCKIDHLRSAQIRPFFFSGVKKKKKDFVVLPLNVCKTSRPLDMISGVGRLTSTYMRRKKRKESTPWLASERLASPKERLKSMESGWIIMRE